MQGRRKNSESVGLAETQLFFVYALHEISPLLNRSEIKLKSKMMCMTDIFKRSLVLYLFMFTITGV